MEMCDDDAVDLQEEGAKLKPKKKSLCRLLMEKKTKVGCFSTESEEVTLPENFKNNCHLQQIEETKDEASNILSPTKGNSGIIKSGDNENKDSSNEVYQIHRLGSPRDFSNSTKLALCCAMTESSRSLNQHISNYHRSNGTEQSNRDEESVSLAALSVTENVKKVVQSVNKASSVDETYLSSARPKEVDSESHLQEKCCQSVPVSRQSSMRISPSLSPSEISSCDSSPQMRVSSRSHLQKHLLAHRRSADNLSISSLSGSSSSPHHSSIDSGQNSPDPIRSYKKRSSSHDTVLPPHQDETDKAVSIPSRGSHGNLAPENGAVRGIVASMDSLARQSLLAAQVLHLIPTTKARERNFLHGRIAATSLLGLVELERTLPNREVRIFVGTWNMNGQAPPPQLNDFMLPDDLEHVPDVIAVGTQESFSERFEWEVHIQETVGPSHLLLHSAALGTIHLAIFIRRDLLWFCSVAEDSSYSVRPGTAFKTKGAVAIGFMLFGTSYLFITTHLTAHLDKVKERIQDVRRIVRSLDLPRQLPVRHKSKDVTQNFDCIFWCGDLNFRLSQPRDEVVQWVAEQKFPVPKPLSLQSDQLFNIRTEGSIFREFEEGPITFPPTYKYDPGTQQFDTSHKQRAPAYTDRILFKSKGSSRRRDSSSSTSAGPLECLMYTSVPSICTSDHKPVWGLYRSTVRPGIDTIPLAAGLFNREVYLEGIKRRAAAVDKRKGTSTICSIQ